MDTSTDRFHARSASDRTDNWPFWFVADRRTGGANVTADIVRAFVDPLHVGSVFASKSVAELLAGVANHSPEILDRYCQARRALIRRGYGPCSPESA